MCSHRKYTKGCKECEHYKMLTEYIKEIKRKAKPLKIDTVCPIDKA